MEQKRSTLATIVVMACTAASRLFGYVKIALIAAFFGASGPADAINAVFAIPNNLRKLFAEGAISSAFIPMLTQTMAEDASGERSRRLTANLVAFLLLVLSPIVALSLLVPGPFVRLLLDFKDPAKFPIAEGLLRWMFNYILFVSLSALAMAVLNSHARFTVAALAPLAFSAAIILGIVVLNRRMGPAAMGLGVLAGGILQLAVMLPSLRRLGYRIVADFRFSSPEFRRTLALWVPFVASASIFVVTGFIAQFFASGLEDGSVSALNYASTVMQLPFGILATSVFTVLFPKMSSQVARGDREGLRDTVTYGFEFLVAMMVPSSVALALFSREIIAAAFQRGQFTPGNTLMAAPVLIAYVSGLVVLSLYQFLLRLFYSLKDFRTPVAAAALVGVIDVGLSLWLKGTRLRVTGLAVANSVAFLFGVLVLAAVAWRRTGGFGVPRVLLGLAKAALASVPMAAILVSFRQAAPEFWRRSGGVGTLAVVAGVLVAGALATVGMFAALRMPFVMELVRRRRAT